MLGKKFVRAMILSIYLLVFGGFLFPPILAIAGLVNLSFTLPFGMFAIGIGFGILIGWGVYERRILKLPLISEKTVCSFCGKEISDNATFCDTCGKEQLKTTV
jgi:hypothetical protein